MKKFVQFLMIFILILQTGFVFGMGREGVEICSDDESEVYKTSETSKYLCRLREEGRVFDLYRITDKNDPWVCYLRNLFVESLSEIDKSKTEESTEEQVLLMDRFEDRVENEIENGILIGIKDADIERICGFVMFKKTDQEHVWRLTQRVYNGIVTDLVFSIWEVDPKVKRIIVYVPNLTPEKKKQWANMGFRDSDYKVDPDPEKYEYSYIYRVLEWNFEDPGVYTVVKRDGGVE